MTVVATTIRYAIYTRQSVRKLEEFSSCDAQFHTCRDCAETVGGPNLVWCGQRFDDEGQSGATLDRPAMNRLRTAVAAAEIDRIYAVNLDRITHRPAFRRTLPVRPTRRGR